MRNFKNKFHNCPRESIWKVLGSHTPPSSGVENPVIVQPVAKSKKKAIREVEIRNRLSLFLTAKEMGCSGSKNVKQTHPDPSEGAEPQKPVLVVSPRTPDVVPADAERVEDFDENDEYRDHLRYAFAWKTHIGVDESKKENQDVVFVDENYGPKGELVLACVMDGHGVHGKLIAEFASNWMRENLSEIVELHKPTDDEIWEQILKQAFEDCEQAIKNSEEIGFKSKMSGTTATVVLFETYNNSVHVANVGDSRAVLGQQEYGGIQPLRLTNDHRPEDDEEMSRIEAAGGIVRVASKRPSDPKSVLPLRVWLNEEKCKSLGFSAPTPGLMLTRSLGDFIAKMAGVIPEPSITHTTLERGRDKMLLIGSDGLWDIVSDRVAVQMLKSKVSQASNMAEALLQHALERWKEKRHADNIAIITASIT